MNWQEFKDKVDAELGSISVNAEEVEISWIDTHCPDEDLRVSVTQGSDGRIEMEIADV
jgi:hypothetical protein